MSAWVGEITKADLEMAVFLSQGEVDRYRILLEHDIRAFELMDPEIAGADTVRLPMTGLVFGQRDEVSALSDGIAEFFIRAHSPADASTRDDDVITHVDGEQARTDETRHVYRAPVM